MVKHGDGKQGQYKVHCGTDHAVSDGGARDCVRADAGAWNPQYLLVEVRHGPALKQQKKEVDDRHRPNRDDAAVNHASVNLVGGNAQEEDGDRGADESRQGRVDDLAEKPGVQGDALPLKHACLRRPAPGNDPPYRDAGVCCV